MVSMVTLGYSFTHLVHFVRDVRELSICDLFLLGRFKCFVDGFATCSMLHNYTYGCIHISYLPNPQLH